MPFSKCLLKPCWPFFFILVFFFRRPVKRSFFEAVERSPKLRSRPERRSTRLQRVERQPGVLVKLCHVQRPMACFQVPLRVLKRRTTESWWLNFRSLEGDLCEVRRTLFEINKLCLVEKSTKSPGHSARTGKMATSWGARGVVGLIPGGLKAFLTCQ